MKIAVLGYGTIGKSVCEYASHSSLIEIKYILRRPGKAYGALMTENYEEILADREVEVVVDALSGREDSLRFMSEALKAKKHVVSANKAALASGFRELIGLARENRVSLRFEASSGGTIPVVSEISSLIRTNTIFSVYGIMNGTSNYIIDRMLKDGLDFGTVLLKAKSLGYAETDPEADICGFDVKNKLIILASLAFQGFVTREFPVFGIDKLTKKTLDYFASLGKSIKLLGISLRKGDNYALGVVPCVIDGDCLEAHVPLNYNIITVTGDMCQDLKFYGQGAGGRPTADAIMRDVLSLKDFSPEDNAGTFKNNLKYDPDLIKGIAYIGTQKYDGSLQNLFDKAKEKGEFMAFERRDI